MRRLAKTRIQPLDESLRELGLDPEKTVGQIMRSTSLVEHRFGGGSPGFELPPAAREPAASTETPAAAPQATAQGGEEELDEAFKVVRKLFKTAGQKVKEKLARKKMGLAKLRRKAKMFRRSAAGRKAKKRQKKKLKKFGAAMLSKLHKMRKRVVMSDEPTGASLSEQAQPSELQKLRESLNAVSRSESAAEDEGSDSYNGYEEASYNASILALHLAEIFEMAGDTESADTMLKISDDAADLSEMLDGFDEGDALDEDQEERFMRIMDATEKALRLHEEMGCPTADQVVEFRWEHDRDAFIAECEEEGDAASEEEEEEVPSNEGDPPSASTAPASEEGGKPGSDLSEVA